MNGRIDESLRALLDIKIRSSPDGPWRLVTTWVDSALNGHLVISKSLIHELGLVQEAATEAILADGNLVILEAYLCYVDWCGKVVPAQVIANEGRFPLLGTELLMGSVIVRNYQVMTVTVT